MRLASSPQTKPIFFTYHFPAPAFINSRPLSLFHVHRPSIIYHLTEYRRLSVMSAPRLLSANQSVRASDPPYKCVPASIIQEKSDNKSGPSLSLFDVPSPPSVVTSPNGIIHVLGYTPKEGEGGVPITVRIHFQPELSEPIYVRLLVGRTPIPTKVREMASEDYGRWQLDGAAPPHEADHATTAFLSVQALNDNNIIVDTVTFGQFSYWAPSCSHRSYDHPSRAFSSSQSDSPTNSQHDADNEANRKTSLRRRLSSLVQSHAEPDRNSSPKMTQQVRLHRRMKTQSLMRTRLGAAGDSGEELYAQTPILELITPLNSMCNDWTPAEAQAGRRLVRFCKVQQGRRLIVSCETISQEEYCEQDSVISCIYQEATSTCFVTSVDVIYLLERLTNGEFPVEEKNRIRRNLEGLRPTTVSKHKAGYENFFQRIMEFPDPKPRNIEKDLKVFKWNLLGQALEKILSKYSIYTTTVADSTDSAPPEAPLSEISDPVTHRLPEDGLEHTYGKPCLKAEPLADDPQMALSEADMFEGSSSSPQVAYPLYEADMAEPESPTMWTPDFKPSTISTYDAYDALAYDMVESLPSSGNYSEGAGYELSPYGLSFSDMAEQAMNNISECYM